MSATQTRPSSVTLTKDQANVILTALNREYARENNRRQMMNRKASAANRIEDYRSATTYMTLEFQSAIQMTRIEEAHKAVSEVAR